MLNMTVKAAVEMLWTNAFMPFITEDKVCAHIENAGFCSRCAFEGKMVVKLDEGCPVCGAEFAVAS